MKKIAQTDAIFQTVFEQNQASDDNPHSLRISIHSKAKVKIGNLSRGGKARTIDPQQADDHAIWSGKPSWCPLEFSTLTPTNSQSTWGSRLKLVILSSIV